jgi:hypothetical protein
MVVKSLSCRGRLFGGVDKLPNIRPLLVEVGHMLGAQFLIRSELLLRPIFLSGMNVSLSKAVITVREISVKL